MANDETALLKLIADVLELSDGEPVTWAIDLNADVAAQMIALLTDNGQQVLYIPGRTVHHASGSYRGDGKTEARRVPRPPWQRPRRIGVGRPVSNRSHFWETCLWITNLQVGEVWHLCKPGRLGARLVVEHARRAQT